MPTAFNFISFPIHYLGIIIDPHYKILRWFRQSILLKISIVSSAITRVSFTGIGYNAIDEQANAVCITRNLAYACWLLHDFSSQREDIIGTQIYGG
jgi:hypothetical protein